MTSAGKVVNNWPLRCFRYRLATWRPKRRDFLPVAVADLPLGEPPMDHSSRSPG